MSFSQKVYNMYIILVYQYQTASNRNSGLSIIGGSLFSIDFFNVKMGQKKCFFPRKFKGILKVEKDF
jgi:hypothetical protein